jgi:hypothetical protein
MCARCHGTDHTGSAWREHGREIPDFTSAAWHQGRSDAQLVVSILEGKGTRMPAFNDKVSTMRARALVRLIRTANPAAPAVRTAAGAGGTDFETRYAALQKEMDELRRQFRELSRTSSRPRTNGGGSGTVSGSRTH